MPSSRSSSSSTQSVEEQPVSRVQWVDRDQIQANTWNPNHVAPPEMELLRVSIEEDGWTQPIVVQEISPDSELGQDLGLSETRYEVVDGFHRWKVSGEERIGRLTDYLVPVVVVTLDPAHARLSTIRHNRARGTHRVGMMADIVSPEHAQAAAGFRRLWSAFEENRDLILMGAYAPGNDPLIDEAIVRRPELLDFLTQPQLERAPYDASIAALTGLMAS